MKITILAETTFKKRNYFSFILIPTLIFYGLFYYRHKRYHIEFLWLIFNIGIEIKIKKNGKTI